LALKKKNIPNSSPASLSAQAAALKSFSIEMIGVVFAFLRKTPFKLISTTNQDENEGQLKI